MIEDAPADSMSVVEQRVRLGRCTEPAEGNEAGTERAETW
jgi:hypothetical protein